MHDVTLDADDGKIVRFQRRHREDRLTPFVRVMLEAAHRQGRLLHSAEFEVWTSGRLPEDRFAEVRQAGMFLDELVRAARRLPGDLSAREQRWIETIRRQEDEYNRRYWALLHTMQVLRTGTEAGAANHNARSTRSRKVVSA